MITNKAQGIDTDISSHNPFPGLRPFGTEESHLFFGREGQSEIILEYLSKNRFAAVTGASGSGKSSLIYCGLIPILYGGFITGAGSSWRIIATRPGNKPVRNLSDALVESESKHIGRVFEEQRSNLTYSLLRRSPYGLVDAISQMHMDKSENLLLIIDQFEELFRYKDSRIDTITTLNESEAFIKLLVNAVKQTKQSIYVVLTMRSDFIGECSEFQELTALINESNFLVPQMTREDFKQAIMGPVSVAGAKADPQLIQHILNTIGDKSDQLPVLQHAMMRTWDHWKKHSGEATAIGIRDYEAAGKLENALSMHANEAFEELSDEGKRICKSLFRTLTEKGADNKGIRHPATVDTIANIAQSSDEEIIKVIEKFRASGRSFLTPSEKTELESNTVVDISHESLMRVWDKLKDWVEEEFSSVQMYMRLSEASSMYQLGKTGLWRPPDLHLALNWRKTQKPTLAWAKKYNPAFEKVIVFLDASEKKFQQEEQNKVKLQRRTLNRTRKFAATMGGVSLLFIVMAYFIYTQYKEVNILRKIAEASALTSETKAEIAIESEQEARERALMARIKADSVEKASLNMLLAKDVETQEAYELVNVATQKTEELQVQTTQAVEESEKAKINAQQSELDRLRAEEQQRIELRKRMLSLSQSMAIKALTIEDPDLKGLLAYHSYKFNKDYKGASNNPDIYQAFYNSFTNLESKNYNTRKGHDGHVRSIVFIPKTNIFYSTGGDGQVFKWDLGSSSKIPQLLIRNNYMNKSLVISNDGRWLACGSSSTSIQVFNLKQPNQAPKQFDAHIRGVLDIQFIPGKQALISTGGDNKILVWDLLNFISRELGTHTKRMRSVTVSPSGNYVYSGSDDGKVIRWDIQSGTQKEIYSNSARAIYKIVINKAGNKLAIGDVAGYATIINLSNNTAQRIKAHNTKITDVKFSPDNSQLATSSMDGTIKMWKTNDIKGGKPIVIKEQESWVYAIAYSSDGKNLISSSDNGNMLYIWPSKTDNFAGEICPLLSRNMTTQEWETYVGYDVPYEKACSDKN